MAKIVFLSDIQQWIHDALAEYFAGEQVAYLDEYIAKYLARKYFALYSVPFPEEQNIPEV